MHQGISGDGIYPGTPWHQAMLRHIVAYYHDDPRLLALTLFGSLTRGSWDRHSDLDLDVVVRENVRVDALQETKKLCASLAVIGEHPLLIVPNKTDAADVVLVSLGEFSIRYHPLAATSPNIVESVRMLSGRIPLEAIQAAGTANLSSSALPEADSVDAFLRLALAVDREVHRQHFWQALALLEGMRTLVVEMFAHAQGGGRPFNVFQSQASPALQEHLAATLPQPGLFALRQVLVKILEIVEQEHEQLGVTQGLTGEQKILLAQIKQKQEE